MKQEVYDPLISKLWKTKGIRFAADERLRAKNRWSIFSLSIMSLYLIALSVVSALDPSLLPENAQRHCALISLFLSVFILIIGLTEAANNYVLEADRMHRCGLDVLGIYQNLELLLQRNDLKEEDLITRKQELLDKYHAALSRYPMNHEERIYEIFKARNHTEFNKYRNNFTKVLGGAFHKSLLVWYWITDFWLYLLFIFSPVLLAVTLL